MREINRIIKFRAWDMDNKTMFNKSCILKNKGWSVKDFINENSEYIVWMQYTGLNDKNGVEIYEGDIVKGDMGNQYYLGDISVVEFYEGGFSPFCDNEDNLPYPYPKKMEIIGNIYENSELLK